MKCIEEAIIHDLDTLYLSKIDKFVLSATEMIHWCLTCPKVKKCTEKYEWVRHLDDNKNRNEATQ